MLKVIKISVLSIFALFAFSQVSMAEEENGREFGDIYSDCGLGAAIAPGNSAVAAVTNVTWDSGTTAVSSNISSPETCQGGKDRVASFIYDSYESIENDLANGSGTHLDALLVLIGRDSQTQRPFVEALRNDFAQIVRGPRYTDENRYQKAEALFNLVYKQVGEIS